MNRVQKTLEDTNLKLGDVVSDIMGKASRMIAATPLWMGKPTLDAWPLSQWAEFVPLKHSWKPH